MRHPISLGLALALWLCSAPMILQRAATAAADSPAPASTSAQNECRGMDSRQAKERADLAFHQRRFQQAGHCYLIAGDKPRADRAFLKATSAEAPAVKRQLTANAIQVKDQFRQFKAAFSSH